MSNVTGFTDGSTTVFFYEGQPIRDIEAWALERNDRMIDYEHKVRDPLGGDVITKGSMPETMWDVKREGDIGGFFRELGRRDPKPKTPNIRERLLGWLAHYEDGKLTTTQDRRTIIADLIEAAHLVRIKDVDTEAIRIVLTAASNIAEAQAKNEAEVMAARRLKMLMVKTWDAIGKGGELVETDPKPERAQLDEQVEPKPSDDPYGPKPGLNILAAQDVESIVRATLTAAHSEGQWLYGTSSRKREMEAQSLVKQVSHVVLSR